MLSSYFITDEPSCASIFHVALADTISFRSRSTLPTLRPLPSLPLLLPRPPPSPPPEYPHPPPYQTTRSHFLSQLPSLKKDIPQALITDLLEKPQGDIRQLWAKLLPKVPSDDRRPVLVYQLSQLSDSQKRALVGDCFLWGSHLIFDSTQSNARATRFLYWGRFLLYGTQSGRFSSREIIPGLYVDPWFHVTSQDPSTALPNPFRSYFTLRNRTRSLTKLTKFQK